MASRRSRLSAAATAAASRAARSRTSRAASATTLLCLRLSAAGDCDAAAPLERTDGGLRKPLVERGRGIGSRSPSRCRSRSLRSRSRSRSLPQQPGGCIIGRSLDDSVRHMHALAYQQHSSHETVPPCNRAEFCRWRLLLISNMLQERKASRPTCPHPGSCPKPPGWASPLCSRGASPAHCCLGSCRGISS